MKSTYDRLKEVFDNVFLDEVPFSRELSATEVDEWDSLLHITLVVSVEKEFGIRFKAGEVAKAQNVGDFIDIIDATLKTP